MKIGPYGIHSCALDKECSYWMRKFDEAFDKGHYDPRLLEVWGKRFHIYFDTYRGRLLVWGHDNKKSKNFHVFGKNS